MCYGGVTAAPAAPAAVADLVDEFSWLDDLDEDADLLSPSAGDSSNASSQLKGEPVPACSAPGMGAPPQRQQQHAPVWSSPMPHMAVPGYAPMAYGAPYMMMPPMVAPSMVAHLAAPPAPAPAAMQHPLAAAAPAPAPSQPQAAPAAAPTPAPLRPGAAATMAQGSGKNRKVQSPEELDAAIERIKSKRRESAQRSRNRRAHYVRQLENENQALRDEVARLRAALNSVGAQA